MERTAFFARLRDRLLDIEGRDLASSFPATPASGTDASAERFLMSLRAVNGDGSLVARKELPSAIAMAFAKPDSTRSKDMKESKTALVTPDVSEFDGEIDAALNSAGFDVLRPATRSEWRTTAARAALGVTSAVLGVAATGSVLIGGGADSPRAASILPETHLVILPADRLVPGLEEALDAVAAMAPTHSSPFLVTGPSRTSDIEMEMVLGAHGPRRLHVLLVR